MPQQIEGEFCLWEQLVPLADGEVVVNADKDEYEVCFEIFDGYFSDVAAVAVWLDKFESACFLDELFHVARAFVVHDVFLGDDAGGFNAVQ